MAQDRAQPGRGLGVCSGSSGSVRQPLVGFQERLLNNPREVNLVAQAGSDLEACQQPEVSPKPLQVLGLERTLSAFLEVDEFATS